MRIKMGKKEDIDEYDEPVDNGDNESEDSEEEPEVFDDSDSF